jgi:hypothetical protein
MFRSQISFSIAVFTADALASAAGVVSHCSRVVPNPTSTISSRSRSWHICIGPSVLVALGRSRLLAFDGSGRDTPERERGLMQSQVSGFGDRS